MTPKSAKKDLKLNKVALLLLSLLFALPSYAGVDLDSIELIVKVKRVTSTGIWVVGGNGQKRELFVEKRILDRPIDDFTPKTPAIIKLKYDEFLVFHKKNYKPGTSGGGGDGH